MFEPQDDLQFGAQSASDADLVREIERQTQREIAKLRKHERRARNVRVDLWPGNSSAANDVHLVGRTNDISEGGCAAIFPAAVLPGDIFRLGFDSEVVDIPLVFARALRCRMLNEGSFEVGFRFFNQVRLIDEDEPQDDSLLD